MAAAAKRSEKVRRIFDQFDANADGGLDRDEMAALVVGVNPRVKFSDEQISAILDEVFRSYSDFISPGAGLTLDGLLRTYDAGAGDVDRDFDALSLGLPYPAAPAPAAPSSIIVEHKLDERLSLVELFLDWVWFGLVFVFLCVCVYLYV